MPAAVPLLEIGVLLIALLAIALAQQITNIMRAVANLVRDVWLVGGALADGVDAVAQGISYVLGKAEAGVDSAIGASWHLLARYMDKTWSWIEGQASAYLGLAELVTKLVYAHSGLRTLVHRAEAVVRGIEHGVKTLEREYRGIEHRVKTLERDITNGIGHDLHIGLRDLTREVKGVEHTVDTTIPKAIGYAEGLTSQLRDFIKAVPGSSYLDWVGGIVAAGLAAIGMEWLVCRNRDGVNGKKGCDLWDEIESVLGIALVTGLTLDLPALIADAQKAAPGIVAAFDELAGIDG